MAIKYEVTQHRFEHDPDLEQMVRDLAAPGTMSIQEILDSCARKGHDGRATATEIGILLMDKVLRPTVPTERISGSTVVGLAQT